MKSQTKQLDFTGQKIFVGIDVHKTTWKVATCTKNTKSTRWPVTIQKPFVINVKSYLDKHFAGAQFLCAYEAGFSGFWIKEELEKVGLSTLVAHAADIPTSDKERKQKEDKRDARKIATALRGGQIEGIYVPTQQAQLDRSIVRERYSIAKSLRRVKSQIKSHLAFFNMEISDKKLEKYWSSRYIAWLEEQRESHSDERLGLQIARLHSMRKTMLLSNRSIRKLSQAERHQKLFGILISVPGVGLLTSMLLIGEIIDMGRFANFDSLCSYVGFIPTTNSSAEKDRKGNLTKRCNGRLRSALVESSWSAIKNDQELLLKYEKFKERM